MAEVVAPATEHERSLGFSGLMRNRNYALLWWGQLVSEMGNRFHWIAVSLWVYALTGSASIVSLAISSMFAGTLVVGLWAGVLVDRLNRKAILVISDLTRAVLVALIPSLIYVNMSLVYLDLFLVSAATAFFRPALFGVIPSVVGRRDLMPANSFFSAMDSGADIFGPALAGILAYKYGYAPLLYIDAMTYVVSGLCALAMSIKPVQRSSETGEVSTLTGELIEGFRYIRGDSLQWGLFLLIFSATLVGAGMNSLQTPLAKGAVGITDAQFGTFNSVWGVGFTVASLILGWFGASVRKSLIILGGYFLAFLATGLMGLSRSFESLMMTAFAVGFANTLNYVGTITVLMEHTPARLIGRVMSTRQAAIGLVKIVSPLVFGALADGVGVRTSIIAMASVGAVGTALVVAATSSIWKFDAGTGKIGEQTFGLLVRLTGRVSAEFEQAQQRRLSLVSLLIAFVGWLGLYNRFPVQALGVLIAVLVLTRVGAAIHGRKWLQGGSR